MSADSVIAGINQPPFGLLDLLQTKALGQNPNELLQGVRGTVELAQFWAQGAPVQTVAFGGGLTVLGVATGATMYLEVPPQATWLPVSMTLVATPTGAGDTGRIRPCIWGMVGAIAVPYEFGVEPAVGVVGTTSVCTCGFNFLETPVRAWPGGTRFGIYCHALTIAVTGLTVAGVMRYVELS